MVGLESRSKRRVWDLAKRSIVRSEDSDLALEREIGVNVRVLLGQEGGELREILLVVEQFSEVDGLLLSECERGEKGKERKNERTHLDESLNPENAGNQRVNDMLVN